MKRGGWLVVALLAFAFSAGATETNDETAARKAATDVAGAFANDNFKTRDGFWTGTVKPHESSIVAVNLYAGNQYWFSAGATTSAKKITVEIFDEAGHPLRTETYSAGEKAAAGFSPTNSGQYYVSVGVAEGEAAVCCLIYSYK